MPADPRIDLSALPEDQREAVAALLRERDNLESGTAALEADAVALKAEAAALQTRNTDLTAETTELKGIVKRLEHLVAELNHVVHGKTSEKLAEDNRQLAFEDLEVAVAEIEERHDTRTAPEQSPRRKPAPAKRNRGNLPESLPRIEQVVEPDSLECPCGCGTMHRIGEDRTERLDIVPAQLRVMVTVRPKYACRACTDGVTQGAPSRAIGSRGVARAPAASIEGGLPTEGAIAHVLVGSEGRRRQPVRASPPNADHLPMYRQSQILARSGVEIHRSTLAEWAGLAAFHLGPVVDRLAAHLKGSDKLFMDETTAPVLDPGRGRTKTGYLWALARDNRAWGGVDPPGVVYVYAPGRGGENAERILRGFDGTLQLDGYTGYNRLTRPSRKGGEPIRVAYCWAHARRKLKEVFDRDGSEIAAEGLRRIAELYKIEAEVRGMGPGQRLSARKARTAPLVAAFGDWLHQQRLRISAKSVRRESRPPDAFPILLTGEKLAYIHRHWDGLQTFLHDGRVEIDSNAVENLIRPIALNRKNALFAGHDEGGKTWGRIASLIETAKANGVEPFAYLRATLEAIANGHPNSRIDDLLPWNFKPSS